MIQQTKESLERFKDEVYPEMIVEFVNFKPKVYSYYLSRFVYEK